ncbi:Helix-turn-helix domain containing protein [Plantibacter sp. RU18]
MPGHVVQPTRLSRRLSPELVTEIVDNYEAGITTTALCAEYSLSKGGLLKILGERGVEMRRQSLDAEQLNEAIRLYETGLSLQAVATRLGVSYNCVRQRFVKELVPRRPRGGSYTR